MDMSVFTWLQRERKNWDMQDLRPLQLWLSNVLLDIKVCGSLKSNRCFGEASGFYLFYTSFLFGSLFDSEDWSDMFFEKSVNFQQNSRSHILRDRNVKNTDVAL
jgi:hypothetical protein